MFVQNIPPPPHPARYRLLLFELKQLHNIGLKNVYTNLLKETIGKDRDLQICTKFLLTDALLAKNKERNKGEQTEIHKLGYPKLGSLRI